MGLGALLSYLYGSVPFLDLLARSRGIDLTASGSGNVGATNLAASAGKGVAAVGWIADASKGLVPVLLSRRFGHPDAEAGIFGAAGVAGQCWPVFRGFRGGRGVAPFVGAAFGIDRVAWAVAILPMIAGGLVRVVSRLPSSQSFLSGPERGYSKSVPLGALGAILLFPVACAARRRPIGGPLLISGLLLARRVTAPLPDDATSGPRVHPRALLNRLLYDRNTSR